METIKIIAILLLTIPFSGFMLWHILTGVKKGSVRHTDTQKTCNKKEKPLKFWFIIFVYTLFLTALLQGAYKALLQ